MNAPYVPTEIELQDAWDEYTWNHRAEVVTTDDRFRYAGGAVAARDANMRDAWADEILSHLRDPLFLEHIGPSRDRDVPAEVASVLAAYESAARLVRGEAA